MNDIVRDFTHPVAQPMTNGSDGKAMRRFNLISFEQITLSTDPAYLIKELIPRDGLIVVWGPPKCGKTFWVFDAAMHIARGLEYRGRRTKGGAVVYIACEGERGLGARKEAYRREHGVERADFHLLTTRLDLVGDNATLIADIAAQCENPVAIVIDTLNRSIRGSESSDEDMSNYVKAADAIREAFSCAVIIVHHCGIEGSRPRGHTSLTGACDAQAAVKKAQDGTITCTVEYMKDGPEGAELHSKLRVVEVGTDEDGDAITSCIIEPVEAPEGGTQNKKLSPRMKRGLDALHNCIADLGKTAPDSTHYPAGTRVVSVEQWREHLFSTGALDREVSNPRADFKRLRDGLADRGVVREWNGLIWPV